MLPAFNNDGDLPLGIHTATLQDIMHRFASTSAQRRAVGLRLERIYNMARATGHLARFIIFGSFITQKVEPNDVDVFLLMEGSFDAGQISGETAILFDHRAAHDHFGASIFRLRKVAAWGGRTVSCRILARSNGAAGSAASLK